MRKYIIFFFLLIVVMLFISTASAYSDVLDADTLRIKANDDGTFAQNIINGDYSYVGETKFMTFDNGKTSKCTFIPTNYSSLLSEPAIDNVTVQIKYARCNKINCSLYIATTFYEETGNEYFVADLGAYNEYITNYTWETNPDTSNPWTWNDVYGLEFGANLTTGVPYGYIYECYLIVNVSSPFTWDGNTVIDTIYFGGQLEVDYNAKPKIDESSALPPDGSTGNSLPITLSINVSDPDGDNIVVNFYDNSDDSLIGTDACAGNRTATTSWSGLDYDTVYEWYVIVTECPPQGSDYTNTSSVFDFRTIAVSTFGELRYFGGRLEVDALGESTVDIWNNGVDYFCWKGDNGTLSDVASVIANFDENNEYVAVWNNSNWDTSDWCWIKYYGDGNGTDAIVNQLDVIKVYMSDTDDKQTIIMTTIDPPTCTRTVALDYTGNTGNKGYNYTCYCCNIQNLVNLSEIATAIPLQTGEVVSWWDNSSQEWRGWIEGFSTPDYDYLINVTSPIFETKINKDVSWVITCP